MCVAHELRARDEEQSLNEYFFAHFFGISKFTVVIVFISTLDVMFFRFSDLILWPPKEQQ